MLIKRLCICGLGLLFSVTAAEGQTIYTNGPVTTGIGNGANGTNTSVIGANPTTGTAGGSFGYGHSGTVRLSDNFVVPAGETWTVTGVTHLAYITGTYGNPPVSTISSISLNIRDLPPSNPASVVLFSSTTLQDNGFTGTHRVTATTLTNAQRPLFRAQAGFAGIVLPAGEYWMDVGGFNAGFAPPATVFDPVDNRAELVPGNALQQLTVGGLWNPVSDAGMQIDFPFSIQGSVVPEPGLLFALTLVGAFGARRLRKS